MEVLESPGKTLVLDKVKVQLESYKAFKEGKRIIVNQGGTRSGKTYGIVKLLIGLALKQKLSISMTSLSFPHLRKGALRDWRTIMEKYELYSVPEHMRTENTYYYPNGSYMEFFSVDDHLKVRGPGRDILFINEANLIDLDTFRQLLLRTRVAAFIDYNPADEFHWIYDHVLTRPDCAFIQSTYKNNPFLPIEQVREIEQYKEIDENYWRIYGEGERGHSEGVIYTHWSPYTSISGGAVYYGLDFGFSNPTALVKVTEKDKAIYAEEILYQSHFTNTDLIEIIKQLVPRASVIYCDSEDPNRIAELQRAGIMAKPANKDVKNGILFLKSRKLFIHQGSVNLLKEIKSYKFVGKENKDLIPLKTNDHACFIGITQVETINGPKRIDSIDEGDWVLTGDGRYDRVLKKYNNGYKATHNYCLLFDTFSVSLVCTDDHLIKTERGWKQISQLESGMILSLTKHLMGEFTFYNQGSVISNATNGICIKRYGNFITESAMPVNTFTTSTGTNGITELKTLQRLMQIPTYLYTSKKGLGKIKIGPIDFIQLALGRLWRGISQRMGLNGTKNTLKNNLLGTSILGYQIAKSVVSNTPKEKSIQNSVIQTARLVHIEKSNEATRLVWDIEVANSHEYFANGVLVHNCDALRYATTAMRAETKQSQPMFIR